KPTFAWPASGPTCTGPSTPPVRRWIACCRPNVMWSLPSTSYKMRCGGQGRSGHASSTSTDTLLSASHCGMEGQRRVGPALPLPTRGLPPYCARAGSPFCEKADRRKLVVSIRGRGIANDLRIRGDEQDPQRAGEMVSQGRYCRSDPLYRAGIRDRRVDWSYTPANQSAPRSLFATDPASTPQAIGFESF